MKIHEKKKAYRLWCQKQLKAGFIATPDSGMWTQNQGKTGQERDTRAGCAR